MALADDPKGGKKRLPDKSSISKGGNGAGKGNRTLIASLEGWSFTIKLCPRLFGTVGYLCSTLKRVLLTLPLH